MTTLREAARQALEALEAMQSYAAAERKGLRICDEAIDNLRAALAEHDKNLAWFKDRKANWDLQRKLAEETQERDRQQSEYEEATHHQGVSNEQR